MILTVLPPLPPQLSPRRAWVDARRPLAALLVTLVGLSSAHALEAPTEPVVLKVGGRVSHPNRGATAQFDMRMLAQMPQHSVTVQTPWYPEPHKFTGPLLREVLAAAGASGREVEAYALNDYRVRIPMSDIEGHEVLLARLIDDKPMPVRDKGPLFILYPFDREPGLRTTVYYSRCAWQLKALDVH